MKHLVIMALIGVLAACGSQPAAVPAPTTLPPVPSPATDELDATAREICTDHAWIGIRDDTDFSDQAADLEATSDVVLSAVRRACPDTVYTPLAPAEIDWCGDGRSFGLNYFKVVAAGVKLGIESFAIVEGGLVSRAADGVKLTDYEIELLTAELQTMSESSRFERDWAEACRSTF